jgi:hypothetical protein
MDKIRYLASSEKHRYLGRYLAAILVFLYLATMIIMALSDLKSIFLTLATLQDITPPLFIQGVGPALLRQSVLGTAVVLFLLSALVMMRTFSQRKRDFHYWYSLSMGMIALGLMAFFIQTSVGSLIGWLGRSGQYIGGIYALIAI